MPCANHAIAVSRWEGVSVLFALMGLLPGRWNWISSPTSREQFSTAGPRRARRGPAFYRWTEAKGVPLGDGEGDVVEGGVLGVGRSAALAARPEVRQDVCDLYTHEGIPDQGLLEHR
jgi:hypothetical protein